MHRFNQSRRATRTPIAIHDSPSLLPHYEAVLIADVRPVSSSVRTQAFSSGWSRVYRAGNYYVDVSVQPGWASPVLIGRVVPVAHHNQTLAPQSFGLLDGEHGERSTSLEVDTTGFFRLELGYGIRSNVIRLALEDATVSVSGLGVIEPHHGCA